MLSIDCGLDMFSENATSTAYGMPSLLLIYMKVNNATSINFGTCHLASLSNTDATTGRLDICRAYATMSPDWHLNNQKLRLWSKSMPVKCDYA